MTHHRPNPSTNVYLTQLREGNARRRRRRPWAVAGVLAVLAAIALWTVHAPATACLVMVLVAIGLHLAETPPERADRMGAHLQQGGVLLVAVLGSLAIAAAAGRIALSGAESVAVPALLGLAVASIAGGRALRRRARP